MLMSEENKQYDGITYRHPDEPPLLFKILYYGLWVWGLCFMGYFLFSGWSSHERYESIKKAKEARLAAERLKGAGMARVPTTEERGTAHLVKEGKELFATRCASCHGVNAKGGIGPDLTRKQYKYGRTAPEVTTTIGDGRPGGMPPFKNELSTSQIEALVQYVLSL
jgi:cytochrome c oxidase cbb3-type subunit III